MIMSMTMMRIITTTTMKSDTILTKVVTLTIVKGNNPFFDMGVTQGQLTRVFYPSDPGLPGWLYDV